MKKIEVQTAQNVTLKFEPAGIGDRILAFIIDGIIIIALVLGLSIVFNNLPANDSQVVRVFYLIMTFIPYLLYHPLSEILLNGQSIGKMQRKIRVIKIDGSEPGIGSYIMRWLMRPIDIYFFGIIAILTIVFNEKGQRLGDLAANTTIIKTTSMVKLEDLLVFSDLHDETYEPVFWQVTKLSDNDFNLIKRALISYQTNPDPKLIHALANKIKKVLNIENNQAPLIFLKTVVKDYAHITSKEDVLY